MHIFSPNSRNLFFPCLKVTLNLVTLLQTSEVFITLFASTISVVNHIRDSCLWGALFDTGMEKAFKDHSFGAPSTKSTTDICPADRGSQ